MGRSKKAQKVVKKKVKVEVATVFKCLFCNHEKAVSCKLNLNSMIGELVCRICDAKFETQINTLTDPIDVFSEWIDEANELQEQEMRRQMEGLPGRAQGYVGDGNDYVDAPGGGDLTNEEDNEVVGSRSDDEVDADDTEHGEGQSMQERSASPDRDNEEEDTAPATMKDVSDATDTGTNAGTGTGTGSGASEDVNEGEDANEV